MGGGGGGALESGVRSSIGAGMFLSNLEPVESHQCAQPIKKSYIAVPPGAVQGIKGSGCFHRSNSASVSRISSFHQRCQYAVGLRLVKCHI